MACRYLSLCVGGICAQNGCEKWIQREKSEENVDFQLLEQYSGTRFFNIIARAGAGQCGRYDRGACQASARDWARCRLVRAVDKAGHMSCADWLAPIACRGVTRGGSRMVDRRFGCTADGRHVSGHGGTIFGRPEVAPKVEN